MLQATQDLLERGDMAAARGLLQQAVSAGGDDAQAAALQFQLERRERARATASIGPDLASGVARPRPAWRRFSSKISVATIATIVMLGVAAVGVGGLAIDLAGHEWLASSAANDVVAVTPARTAPVVLATADVAIVRARTLYAHGRLAEALQALDRVPASSGRRTEADGLAREIQRLLLATAPAPPRAAPGGHTS
jgi:hypothetical protein